MKIKYKGKTNANDFAFALRAILYKHLKINTLPSRKN